MEDISNLQQLQILIQLLDNLEIAIEKFEKSYKERNLEDFNKYKNEILDLQNKISKNIY